MRRVGWTWLGRARQTLTGRAAAARNTRASALLPLAVGTPLPARMLSRGVLRRRCCCRCRQRPCITDGAKRAHATPPPLSPTHTNISFSEYRGTARARCRHCAADADAVSTLTSRDLPQLHRVVKRAMTRC